MNDLIQKLADQARDYANDEYKNFSNLSGWFALYNQKLAELIVRECAKFFDDNSGCDYSNNCSWPETKEILDHFGVEE